MNSRNKNILMGIVVVVLLGLAGWYALSHKTLVGMGGTNATSTAAVATVNGETITRGALDKAEAQLSSEQGTQATSSDAQAQLQSQAMDSLISRTLLQQAAKAAGVTASSTEVASQLASAKAQFSSDAEYQQALAQQGLTEDTLRQSIEDDSTINAYLEQTLNLSSITATDAEIQAMYTQLVAGQAGAPALTAVRAQVEQAVVQQKQQQLVAAQIAKLRAAGSVQILI